MGGTSRVYGLWKADPGNIMETQVPNNSSSNTGHIHTSFNL